ncbi:hypothetical protein GC106_44890 [Kibdelosporangium sp. 4NS15]|uniref:Uncharacterized protein n=1 Tax=Kibdelosporangium persicum TaxID=2698649 RepID=A0ABX2F7C8_9PSEU|nr:hypothetical protein [Kibdelosporangium persicum]
MATLAVSALAACSPPGPAAPPGTTTTPATTQTTTSRPAATSSPTTTKPSPTVAALPDEGRNFASCKDGHCRVHVRPGDRIALGGALGATTIAITAISPAEVSVKLERADGSRGTYTFFDPVKNGALMRGDKIVLAFPEITGSQAVMQVDV